MGKLSVVSFLAGLIALLFPSEEVLAQSRPDGAKAPDAHDAVRMELMRRHLATYPLAYPQERVWIHFDNTAYFQNDTIWFKAYVRSTHPTATAVSSTLYVELVAPSGRVLHTRKLKITDGTCHGEIPLTQTEGATLGMDNRLVSGFYEVRAYTRYMLNWGAEAAFSRVFPVYDAPGFAGDYRIQMTRSNEALPPTRPEPEEGRALNVAFFPEGGRAVAGLPCRMAYLVTDRWGNPVHADGELRMADGMTLPTATLHDGMGLFIYTPDAAAPPVLALRADSAVKLKTFPLPKPEPSGYTLTVNNRRAQYIDITVQASADRLERLLGVSIQHEGNLYYMDTLRISGGAMTTRRIAASALPVGVCQVTLFGADGFLADRLFFVAGDIPLADSMEIAITPSALRPDEVCRMAVATRSPSGAPMPAVLSVAIRDAEATCAVPVCEDPRIALLLASEVKGYIHRPQYYFESDDNKHRQALDLLLLTQGWRRHDWTEYAGLATRPFQQYLETGLILNGHAYNRRGRKPIVRQNIHIKLRDPDRRIVIDGECETDSVGNFNFLLDDFEGKWELSIRSDDEHRRPRALQYRIDRNLSPSPRPYAAAEMQIPAPRTAAATARALDEVQTLAEVEVAARRKRKEGIHLILDAAIEQERLLDEGVVCTDVETFLEELDLGFHVTLDAASLGEDTSSEATTDIDLMSVCTLWGDEVTMVCTNPSETRTVYGDRRRKSWLLDLPIEEVSRIELYDRTFAIAHRDEITALYTDSLLEWMLLSDNAVPDYMQIDSLRRELSDHPRGIVLVTAKPKMEQRTAPRNYRITTFDGYYHPRTFTADYTHRQPAPGDDYRRTLYWNPDLRTDSTGRAELTFRHNSTGHNISCLLVGLPDGALAPPHPAFRAVTLRSGIAE